VTQANQHHRVGLGAGDRERQRLVLLVEAVEHRPLLLAVGHVVERVEVEPDPRRRRVERIEKLFQ